MTIDPLLLKTAEYVEHINNRTAARLPYFNPKGPTASPWTTAKTVPSGLALVTLKQIQQCLPDLEKFVQRTSGRIKFYHPMLHSLNLTIRHIRTHCAQKVQNAPNRICAKIYEGKVMNACSKIIRDVGRFSLLEMTKRVEQLLPLGMSKHQSRIMRLQIDALAPLINTADFTAKMQQQFERKKSYLKSIISLHNVLWKMEFLVLRFRRPDVDDRMAGLIDEAFNKAVDRCHKHFYRHPSLTFKGVSMAIAFKCQQFNFMTYAYNFKRTYRDVHGFFRKLIS